MMIRVHGCRADVEFVNELTLIFDQEANGFAATNNDLFLVIEVVFHRNLDCSADIRDIARRTDFDAIIMTATMTCTSKCRSLDTSKATHCKGRNNS